METPWLRMRKTLWLSKKGSVAGCGTCSEVRTEHPDVDIEARASGRLRRSKFTPVTVI